MSRFAHVVVGSALAAMLTLSACADTVIEVDTDTTDLTPGGSAATTSTVPIEGTAADLLPAMAVEMSRLSAQIADEGDERATLARIEAIWSVAQHEIEAQRRDLATGIQTTVDMARNAVVRVRPADADKAFQLFTDLVDRYTSEG